MNAINIIAPYKHLGMWVFDDPRHYPERLIMIRQGGQVIPAHRYKTNLEHVVPLSRQAKAILNSMPVIGRREQGPIFTTDGVRPLNSFSHRKKELDRRIQDLKASRYRDGPFTISGARNAR